ERAARGQANVALVLRRGGAVAGADFFFQQMVAYDVSTGLEFIRVLFRAVIGRYRVGENQRLPDRQEVERLAAGIEIPGQVVGLRSEERRVGKECRCGGAPQQGIGQYADRVGMAQVGYRGGGGYGVDEIGI